MAAGVVKPAAIYDNVDVVRPEHLFSDEPYRHVLSAASGSRPLPVLPPSACETNEVQQADTSISLGRDTPVIIGIDTEYVQVGESGDKTNRILSYQFAAICSEGAWRGIIYCENTERLTLSGLLGHALELGVRSKLLRKWPSHITVGAHHSNAELASFKDFPKIKREFDAIRKTFTTIKRPYEASYCDRSKHKYSFQVSLIDTQHLTPGGKALAVLGGIYEFPKLDLPPDCDKSRMDLFLQKHPSEFEQYAIRDAEISAFHLYRLHRFARTVLNENEIPLTLASIGLKYLRNLWKQADIDELRVLGLEIIPAQKKFNPRTQRFVTTKPRIVTSDDRDMYEKLANRCYHGGRNETFVFGVTEKDIWTDFDLVGAYTTAMAAIRTPDYRKIRTSRKIERYQADVMGFAKVRFHFPENTRFPCLPVVSRDDHGLIFPLEGEAFVGASEIALARQMGAEIEVVQGVIIPWADEARPFEEFVRNTQKRRGNEKGTFEDKMWKEIGNSLYGKTAQGLRERTAFNPRTGQSTKIPASFITNPFLAAHITSLVRAVLGEILCGVPPNRTVLSATTDGLLTNAKRSEIWTHGPLCTLFADLRERLSGNREILEKKHVVKRVLCMKTRAQATVEGIEGEEKLLARGGVHVPHGVEDHNAFMLQLFREREANTKLSLSPLISLRDLYQEDADLVSCIQDRRVNLEPDHKRELIKARERDGLLYCDTRPWRDVEQFNKNRELFEEWRRCRVLKRMGDWHDWQSYLAGTEASQKGIRRGRDGVLGQAKRLILKAFTKNAWGFGDGPTYQNFANHLTGAGFPTSLHELKNAKRAKFALVKHTIPPGAAGIRELIQAVVDFEPGFDWPSLVSGGERGLVITPRQQAA